jgi:hypothetical protein
MAHLEISLFLIIASLIIFGRALWCKWRLRGLKQPEINRLEKMELRIGLVILAMISGLIALKLVWPPT